MNLIRLVITYRKITWLAVIVLAMTGIFSYLAFPRQEDPDVKVLMAQVVTRFPGASPKQVEKLVTKVLEERVNEMQDVKLITSSSLDSVSVIIVELAEGSDPEKNWDALREKMTAARSALPQDALDPAVNDQVVETNAMVIAVTGPLYSDDELDRYAREVKRTLEDVDGVAGVKIEGLPANEVQVEMDLPRLAQYRLPFEQVIGALQSQNTRIPGGQAELAGLKASVQTTGEYQDLDAMRNTIVSVSPAGKPVYLRDVADVFLRRADPVYLARHNGVHSAILTVTFQEDRNVVSIGKHVRQQLTALQTRLPGDVAVSIVVDQPDGVDKRLTEFTRELLIGMLLVMLVVFLGMGWHNAAIVSLAVPFSLIFGFNAMRLIGVELHQVSIAALIITLGMLVDDAIVVNDNIDRHLSEGATPLAAVVNATSEVGIAVTTSTLTAVAAFLPLAMMGGDTGLFIKSIPQVVSTTMMASLLVVVVVTPLVTLWVRERLRRPEASGEQSFLKEGPLGRFYQGFLAASMRRPGVVVTAALLAFITSLFLVPRLGTQFFPPAERNQLLVDISMPQGTGLQTTDRVVAVVERVLAQQPEVADYLAYTGWGVPKFYYNEMRSQEAANRAQVVVNTTGARQKEWRTTPALARDLREYFGWEIAGAEVKVRELEQGPPVGAPIAVRITGEDLPTLRRLAGAVKQELRAVPGTINIGDDLGNDVYSLLVEVNETRANMVGLTNTQIAGTVRMAQQGIQATTIRQGDDELEVFARMRKSGRGDPADLQNLYFISPLTGQGVPFGQAATLAPGWSLNKVNRRNQERIITVQSYTEGRLAADVLRDIRSRLQDFQLPEGYRLAFGGEDEQRNESFASLGKVGLVALLLVFLILMLEFNSFSQSLLIMLSIPLALVGAVFGLLVTGSPVGFMAFLGVVSLGGIVVKNAIVLVDFINAARREGHQVEEAVMLAGRKRLRPIILTSTTTIGGLIPLTLQGGSLWAPMGYTIIFGLAFSTLLTLVVIPVLYTLLYSSTGLSRLFRLFRREKVNAA